MKIAVLGAGAMGSLYGGMLSRAGHDVVLIDVSESHIDAVNRKGLVIDGPEELISVRVPAAMASNVKSVPELVILFTKTIYSRSALESVKHLLGPDTWMLSLQNGLGNDALISEYLPQDRIIVGTTDFPSTFVAPGEIRSKGTGTTKIMRADGIQSDAVNKIAEILNEGGFNCIVTQDVFVAIWEKVAFNSAMNAITAATRLKLGHVGTSQEGRGAAFDVAREVISVANAKGIKADIDRVLALMDKDFHEHADHKPSMLQDVLQKRQTEVDFINGAAVREAEKLGMKIPVTKTLYQLIKVIQAHYEDIL
jgi:2-dehydropantoate 2-reductase